MALLNIGIKKEAINRLKPLPDEKLTWEEANQIVKAINDLGEKAGTPGASAYEVAVANGFAGTEAQWLASLKGEPGEGEPGDKGLSAYEIALAGGFVGTEVEWLESLKAETDPPVSSLEQFTGDNSTTAFTLTGAVTGVILVLIGGRGQYPGKDYSVSGNTLTFTQAPYNEAPILVLKGTLGYAQNNTAGDSTTKGDRFSHFVYSNSASFNVGAAVAEVMLVDVVNTTRSIYNADKTISGNTVTISHTLQAGDSVRIYWR